MYTQSLKRLEASDLTSAGLDGRDLIRQLRDRLEAVNGSREIPYRDIQIRVTDEKLMALCAELCTKLGLKWGIPSPMNDDSIIQRHRLRDRSEVIAAREAALRARQADRNR